MKGKIIATVGISGSGKSTWAHKKWLEDPSKYTIVNRDKIRELLFGYTESNIGEYYMLKGVSGFEKQITRYEDTLIHEGLNHGKSVIVDSTNLTMKYLERYRYWNVPVEVVVFETGLQEALDRDLNRTRLVGERIITKQYNRFVTLMRQLVVEPLDFTPTTITMNPDNTPVFIFDIDGTLAHMDRNFRSPYEWHKVAMDAPDDAVVDVFKRIHDSKYLSNIGNLSHADIIICTGRDAEATEPTLDWLKHYGLDFKSIHFRKEGDQRADWIVKEEMWRKIAEDNYILGMFDDRLQVVRRARALGLKVFNVEYGNF